MGMQRRVAIVAVALVLLGLVLGACGPRALELEPTPYRDQGGAYTVHYPRGWMYEELPGQVTFYEDEEAVRQTPPTVPVVIIASGTFVEMAPALSQEPSTGPENARDMVQAWLDLFASQEIPYDAGGIKDLTVGQEQAAYVEVAVRAFGDQTQRLVCVHLGDRGVWIAGIGESEAWSRFIPTFDAMLASMTFLEPQQ